MAEWVLAIAEEPGEHEEGVSGAALEGLRQLLTTALAEWVIGDYGVGPEGISVSFCYPMAGEE